MRSLYELSRRRKCHVEEGMTLLEMLFVAALVTVLVTAVRPFCQKHLNRIHPAEAQTYLLRIASLQTQYRLKFGKYSENLADLDTKPNASVEQHYRISIDFPEAHVRSSSYRFRAIPKAGALETITMGDLGVTLGPWER